MEHLRCSTSTDLARLIHSKDCLELSGAFCWGTTQADTPFTGIFQAFALSADQISMTHGLVLADNSKDLIGHCIVVQQRTYLALIIS